MIKERVIMQEIPKIESSQIGLLSLELPTQKSISKKRLEEYTWLIYGNPKIGKSTLASQFQDALFLPTEEGLKSLEVFRMPQDRSITSWTEFAVCCKTIFESHQKGEFKFKTIVIDTIDNLLKLCSDYVCKKFDMQHPTDKEYGKGWSLVTDEFIRMINRLIGLGLGVVFISHALEKTIKTRTIELTQTAPAISGAAGKFIIGLVDVIIYIGFDPQDVNKRLLFCKSSESLIAGDRTGKLPDKLPFSYSEIKNCFSRGEE